MISIIIIVKDDPSIGHLLDRLASLDSPEPSEVVVVDASEGRLDHVRDEHPQAIWVSFAPPSGLATSIPHQRNAGIEAAEGDVFAFIDADCLPEPGWLQGLIEPIRNEDEHLVGGRIGFEGHGHVPAPAADQRYVPKWGNGNLAFTRTLWESTGGYDESMLCCEDYEYCLRARAGGYRVRFAANSLVLHNPEPFDSRAFRKAFRYGRYAAQLYRRHPSALLDRDGHGAFSVYYAAVACLLVRRPRLALALLAAPYLLRPPRSVRRQSLHLAHGTGFVLESLRLLWGRSARPTR